MDAELISLFCKAYAKVADAEALFAVLALEFLDAASPGLSQPVNGREDVHGDVLRDGADVGLGFFGENDALQAAGSLPALRT